MNKLRHLLTTVLICSSLCFSNAWAHENETHYDRIHLSVSASAQLKNDTMVVVVYAQEEGGRVAELSAIVNKRIRWGLDLVKKHPEIKHQSDNYSSDPVYSNNKIKGWRVKQSLRLESQDMTLMSDVLGELQSDLAIQSMQFMVSPDSKNKQDKVLIDDALEAFERRAQQVTEKLGRNNYKIVDINISTSGSGGARPQYQMRAMAMSADSSPAISAGEKKVSVTVSGKIELE